MAVITGDANYARAALKYLFVYGVDPPGGVDTEYILRQIRKVDPDWEAIAREWFGLYGELPNGNTKTSILREQIIADTPEDPSPEIPEPDPVEPPEPVDYEAQVKALYPWLPDNLVLMFADEWADSGDATLALATVRTSAEYEAAFPGIKREDGSLRMTEAEWFSTREAYATLFQEFGLNDTLFADRFTELMEGDVSPMELAGRLGAAYEMISNNIPEVAEAYSAIYGVNGQAALFASFIDPDIGQAILDRQISVAQVAGEGLARGFDVDASFAGKLVSGGVDQNVARNFFVQAEGQLQTLDDLAARHRDPDDTFDLEEFADANVFGSQAQTRRIRRLLRAEASLFTDQLGSVAVGGEGALTGLSAQ